MSGELEVTEARALLDRFDTGDTNGANGRDWTFREAVERYAAALSQAGEPGREAEAVAWEISPAEGGDFVTDDPKVRDEYEAHPACIVNPLYRSASSGATREGATDA